MENWETIRILSNVLIAGGIGYIIGSIRHINEKLDNMTSLMMVHQVRVGSVAPKEKKPRVLKEFPPKEKIPRSLKQIEGAKRISDAQKARWAAKRERMLASAGSAPLSVPVPMAAPIAP